ncbi:MAG TPA: hypothetical protein VGO00_21990 [Kofleriaceae bacterium]|nr:hypothetical protein [Kofleriaceae bacterium]
MVRRALASCSALAVACGVAHADTPIDQPTAFDVDREAPPAGRSELGFDGGAPLETWGVSIGLGYLDRPVVVPQGIAVDHRETFALGGAVAFGTSVVIEARLPLAHQIGDRLSFLGTGGRLDRWVPGDLHFAARARVGGGKVASVFVRGDLGLPTGDDGDFAGDLRYSLAWNLIGRVDLGAVIIAANGGVKLRGGEVLVGGHVVGDELEGALGLIVPIADPVKLTAEFDGALGDNVAGKRGPSPAEVRVGAVVEPMTGLQLGLRVGAGLDEQIGAPRFRAMLEVAWHAPAPPPEPQPAEPEPTAPADED